MVVPTPNNFLESDVKFFSVPTRSGPHIYAFNPVNILFDKNFCWCWCWCPHHFYVYVEVCQSTLHPLAALRVYMQPCFFANAILKDFYLRYIRSISLQFLSLKKTLSYNFLQCAESGKRWQVKNEGSHHQQ